MGLYSQRVEDQYHYGYVRPQGKTWVNVDLRNTSSSSYSVRLQGRLKFECFGPDLTETVFDYKGNLLRLR